MSANVKFSPARRAKGRSPRRPAGYPLAGGPPAPTRPKLTLTVKGDATVLVLHLRGEFDLAGIGRVEQALEEGVRGGIRRVVFDLREVSFLDLAGLMTVMRANERSLEEPFDVQVIPPSGLASRVFTLTRAGAALNMIDDVHIPSEL
jgi:anti-anti-sigma factor